MTPTEIRGALRIARAELSAAGRALDMGKPVQAYGHAERAQHLVFDVKDAIGKMHTRPVAVK